MGVQSLQDFTDSSESFSQPLPEYLEGKRADKSSPSTSNLLVVHADSWIRQLYHEHIDWVCGGQWNELLQSVDKFVHAFRNAGLELVVFFDGSLNERSLHMWASRHRFYREVVRETLSHVANTQSVPMRAKIKNFIAPGCVKSALRLAFRQLNVVVCTSLSDVYRESVLLGRDMNCMGVIGNDANLLLANPTSCYINLTPHTKISKNVLSSCKVYNSSAILGELDLKENQLPFLFALMGNFMISDSQLSSFYWDLIDDDHPLKKLQVKILEAVLPPSEVRLRCVAKFLRENVNELDDVDTLATRVFGKATNITVDEGKVKLKTVVEYFKDVLRASRSAPCKIEEFTDTSPGGFPLPSLSPKYKTEWKFSEKIKQTPPTTTPPKDDSQTNGTDACDQAVVVDEKKPHPVPVNETPTTTTTTEHEKERKVVESYVYPREITLGDQAETLDAEVVKIARKRHQKGQMCPEVLNLLLKREVILDVALDDESCNDRLPIPLIFRPLRQLVYGVLLEVDKCEQEEGKPKEPEDKGTFFDSAEYPESDEKDAKKENGENKETETSSGEAVVNGEDETTVTTTSAADEKGEVEGPEEEKNECSNSGGS